MATPTLWTSTKPGAACPPPTVMESNSTTSALATGRALQRTVLSVAQSRSTAPPELHALIFLLKISRCGPKLVTTRPTSATAPMAPVLVCRKRAVIPRRTRRLSLSLLLPLDILLLPWLVICPLLLVLTRRFLSLLFLLLSILVLPPTVPSLLRRALLRWIDNQLTNMIVWSPAPFEIFSVISLSASNPESFRTEVILCYAVYSCTTSRSIIVNF